MQFNFSVFHEESLHFCDLKVPLQRQHAPESANRIRDFTGRRTSKP